jgi:hypothetical protein
LIATETPAEWKPPPRWRPPAEVAADSNVELEYRGGGGGVAALVVVGVLATIAVPLGFALHKSGAIGGVNAAELDQVTFTETVAAMQQKLGGSLSDDGKWLRVTIKGPFDYAVFNWDEKEKSHPASVSMHSSNRESCPPELEAARAQLRKELGPRFDGSNWRWGPTYLNFDPKCATLGISSSVGDGENENWRPGVEALWRLVLADVFGRTKRPSSESMTGLLGRGYTGATIAPIVAGTTVDDGPVAARNGLPGVVFRQLGGIEADLPLTGPQLGQVDVEWENKKGGAIRSLNVRSSSGELGDHLALARCLGKALGANVEIRETDYVKKTSDASVKISGATVNVSKYGLNAYGTGGSLPAASVTAVMLAIDACQ